MHTNKLNCSIFLKNLQKELYLAEKLVVALLFYVHGKHLRSCRDGEKLVVLKWTIRRPEAVCVYVYSYEILRNNNPYTVEPQWLEHLWDDEN